MLHAFKKNPLVRIGSVGAFADALGLAYGLEGNHKDWAKTPQDQLATQVAAKLPQMMASVGQATRDIGDAFFGENEALAVVADPFGTPSGALPSSQLAPSTQHSPQYAPGDEDIVPRGVPKSSSAMLLLALAVGGVALLLGIVIVVVLLR